MNRGKELAEAHVDWFIELVRPLLLAQFEHGYKHGVADRPKKGSARLSAEAARATGVCRHCGQTLAISQSVRDAGTLLPCHCAGAQAEREGRD